MIIFYEQSARELNPDGLGRACTTNVRGLRDSI